MMPRLVSVFSAIAAVSGLHIDQQQHASASVATEHKNKAVSATRKHQPLVHLKHTINLANTLAVLSRKKQEPAAEAAPAAEGEAAPAEGGAEEPPAGDLPIDEEGYTADWGTEHRSDPYPPESVGKQHNPSYDQVSAKISAELHGHWWWWVIGALLILAIAAGIYKYTQK